MAEQPDRIWVVVTGIQPHDGSAGIWASGLDAHIGATEYVRADLGSFYQEKDIDALMDERDRLREIAHWFVQYAEGVPVHRGEADAMLEKARAVLSQTASPEQNGTET